MNYLDYSNFKELLHVSRIIHADVMMRMKGRMGDPGVDNAAVVGAFVSLGGPGDYAEIGTLWGGSAMVAALVKKAFKIPGKIYCIDPLDGYHVHKDLFVPNEKMEAPVSLNTLMENAAIFDVEDIIVPVQKLSYPWPDELLDNTFSVSYIDGDHTGDMPMNDWLSASPRTSKYVIFDNYETKYPDVVKTCDAIKSQLKWKLVDVFGISCVFERVA